MTGYRLLRGWREGDQEILPALRQVFAYTEAEPDRATGWLLGPDGSPWLPSFTRLGPQLLAALERDTGFAFTACAFQAYLDGAGVGWHRDTNWAAQAILSLGVTRSFGLRRDGTGKLLPLAHGDLLVMPRGFQEEWEHSVPEEDVPGERCSLVFRSN